MSVFTKNSAQSGTAHASLQKREGPFFGVQAKLSIGKPNDKYEREADSVADKVVAKSQNENSINNNTSFFPAKAASVVQKSPFEDVQKQEQEEIQEKPIAETITPVVQLASDDEESLQEKCETCEGEVQQVQKQEDEDVQKQEDEEIQQQEDEEVQQQEDEEVQQQANEEEQIQEKCEACAGEEQQVQTLPIEDVQAKVKQPSIQTKPDEVQLSEEKEEIQEKEEERSVQKQASAEDPPGNTSSLESNLANSRGGGSPLSGDAKNSMESGFGTDFSNVRIHNDSNAVQMNQKLGSQAFASGNDIYFNKGKYNPSSKDGQHLLAHELTHTVQQGASVSSDTQTKPQPIPATPSIQKQDGDDDNGDAKDQLDEPQNDPQSDDRNQDENDQNNNQNGDQNSGDQTNQGSDDGGNVPNQQNEQNAGGNAPQNSGNNEPQDTAEPGDQSNNGDTTAVPINGNVAQGNEPGAMGGSQEGEQGGQSDEGTGDAPLVFPTFEAFTSYVSARKQAVETFYREKNTEIDNFVQAERERAINQVNTEIQRLRDTKTEVIGNIDRTFNSVKNAINTKRNTEIENARATAETELQRIDEITTQKQDLVKEKGNAKALAVIEGGNEQATRANNSTNEKVREIDSIIRRKSNQYRNNDNSDQVTDSAWESKPETAERIRESGRSISNSVAEHAQDLAQNYRDEADNVAQGFTESKGEARDKVIENRDETITALEEAGVEAVQGLETETNNLKAEIERGITQQIEALSGIPNRITEELYDVEIHVKAKLREDKSKTLADIDQFAKDLGDIYWHREEVTEAQTDLEQAITDQETDVSNFVTESNTKLTEGVTAFITELVNTQNRVIPTFTQIATDYDTAANRVQTDTIAAIDEVVHNSEEGARSIGDDLANGMDDKIDEEEGRWDAQLDRDVIDMRERVTEGIEEQSEILDRFESNLDDEFNKGDDFWSFVSGVFAGFWEGFTGFLSAIWEAMGTLIFWIVIAIIVIIIVFLVVVVGVSLALIGKVLLVIGVIIGVIAFIYFLVAAIVTEGLTPYERGRLLGRGLFELAFALIGTGVYARLMGWIPRFTRLVAITARIPQLIVFLRLVKRAGDLKALVRIVDKVDDLVTLFRVLRRIKYLDEIIVMLDQADNFNQIIRVLGAVDDLDALFILLRNSDDAAQLLAYMERAIAANKANALVRILSETTELPKVFDILARSGDEFVNVIKALDDAPDLNRMIVAMNKGIDDLPRFIALINKDGMDVAILVKLVNEADELQTLFNVLENTDDLQKVLNVLDNVDDLNTLLRVLDDADDFNRVIALFNNITDFNLLVQLLDRTTELPKLITYLEGRTHDVDSLLTALNNLGGELDDFLRLMDEPMSLLRMDSLLFMDNFTVARFRALLAAAGNNLPHLFEVLDEIQDLQKLTNYIAHFGDFAAVRQIVTKARASGMTIIVEFLDACITDGFRNWAHIDEFFNRAVIGGVNTPAGWRQLIQYARNFIAENARNFADYPGRTVPGAGGVGSKTFTLADGTAVNVTIEAADIFHYISRHTWKYFRLTMGNVEDLNGMWEVGTGIGNVRTFARNILNSTPLETFVGTMLNGQNRVSPSITIGGIVYEARINLNGVNGMVSIYPTGGANIVSLSRNIMKAAVRLFLSI